MLHTWAVLAARNSIAASLLHLPGCCSLFNNILSPADLDERASIFFFLDGIKPDWDEKETASGGVWTVPVKQRGAEGKSKLEAYWADVVRLQRACSRAMECVDARAASSR